MRANRRKNNIIIGGLCAILLIMTVGYAAFYSQLKISGTSKITSNWDIEITNIRSTNFETNAYNIKDPTYTSNSATFNAGFKVPNDEMYYEIEISNLGTIDGQISIADLNCGNNAAFSCYVWQTSDKYYDDNWKRNGDYSKSEFMYSEGSSDLTNLNFSIKQGEKKYLYVEIKFEDVSSMPDNLTNNIKLTLNYIQYNHVIDSEPVMMARDESKAFWQSAYKDKISTVDVLTNKDVPSDAVESWDVSKNGNGAVMAWIIDDSENSGMYKLYIGGDGGVYAPNYSVLLFSGYNSSFGKTTSMNLGNLDTSKVTYMSGMFYECSSLPSLDVSNFDTSNVISMDSMFYKCSSLTSLDVSNFDTSNVKYLSVMFDGCTSLTSLDVSNFNTSNVLNMAYMFYNYGGDKIKGIENFDTSNVYYMHYMFYGCSNLTSLDLSKWNTSKVKMMKSMFENSKKLEVIKLCDFDTSKVTDMDRMFEYDYSLKHVYVGSKWTTANASTTDMFTGSGVSEVTKEQC